MLAGTYHVTTRMHYWMRPPQAVEPWQPSAAPLSTRCSTAKRALRRTLRRAQCRPCHVAFRSAPRQNASIPTRDGDYCHPRGRALCRRSAKTQGCRGKRRRPKIARSSTLTRQKIYQYRQVVLCDNTTRRAFMSFETARRRRLRRSSRRAQTVSTLAREGALCRLDGMRYRLGSWTPQHRMTRERLAPAAAD